MPMCSKNWNEKKKMAMLFDLFAFFYFASFVTNEINSIRQNLNKKQNKMLHTLVQNFGQCQRFPRGVSPFYGSTAVATGTFWGFDMRWWAKFSPIYVQHTNTNCNWTWLLLMAKTVCRENSSKFHTFLSKGTCGVEKIVFEALCQIN